ncbi:MAG: NAD(P)(+) transhydrogenase (Re/Si-specific) subunit beta, partial [Chitinophagales bacterium]
MENIILWITYLIGSITFILGLKMLGKPESARRGNLVAAAGMTLAIFGTIFLYHNDEGAGLHNYIWIFGGIIIGSVVGTLAAKRVKMTAMPQMVSLFNGMGGACAAIISIVEYQHHHFASGEWNIVAVTLTGLLIGGVSFAGSMMAFGKLNGNIKDTIFPGQSFVNMALLAATLGVGIYLTAIGEQNMMILALLIVMCLIFGILFVMPIGGADMPVVISLLNSFTGVAAA